jgi:predicted ATPase
LKIKESKLGNFIFLKSIFYSKNDSTIFSSFIFKIAEISQDLISLEKRLKNISYISPNRGSQKRILFNNSANDIDEIVVNFHKKSKSNSEDYELSKQLNWGWEKIEKENSYLNRVLEILEIEGKIEVERYENVISVVYIKQGDKKIALADLGYGFSQIIPIVMKVYNLSSQNSSGNLLIIEEPEANLHPNLQSKLADIFALTINTFPGLKLIIETHSEYLIRKLQYLTASKELTKDDTVIYYFNADKYVTSNEPKVKRINIKANGNLSDRFGPGFLDEAERLAIDLLRLKQFQNN